MLVVAESQTTMGGLSERDDAWLRREVNYLWSVFFKDVPRANIVDVTFAPFWKTRLGLITLSQSGQRTSIKVNGFLSLPAVPDYVATITIAHELIHYSHGFGSPLPRKYRHPHRGGVVTKELVKRGLGIEQTLANQWLKENWQTLITADRDGWRNFARRSTAASYQEIGDGFQVANTVSPESRSLK